MVPLVLPSALIGTSLFLLHALAHPFATPPEWIETGRTHTVLSILTSVLALARTAGAPPECQHKARRSAIRALRLAALVLEAALATRATVLASWWLHQRPVLVSGVLGASGDEGTAGEDVAAATAAAAALAGLSLSPAEKRCYRLRWRYVCIYLHIHASNALACLLLRSNGQNQIKSRRNGLNTNVPFITPPFFCPSTSTGNAAEQRGRSPVWLLVPQS